MFNHHSELYRVEWQMKIEDVNGSRYTADLAKPSWPRWSLI